MERYANKRHFGKRGLWEGDQLARRSEAKVGPGRRVPANRRPVRDYPPPGGPVQCPP
jgi:hypothetical protein